LLQITSYISRYLDSIKFYIATVSEFLRIIALAFSNLVYYSPHYTVSVCGVNAMCCTMDALLKRRYSASCTKDPSTLFLSRVATHCSHAAPEITKDSWWTWIQNAILLQRRRRFLLA